MNFRENWRVITLSILLVVSGVLLFAPVVGGSGGDEGATNLQYGIELDGGSRLRAPVAGLTAEDVEVTPDNRAEIERQVANELEIDTIDVTARPSTSTVEWYGHNTSQDAFVEALDAANLSVDRSDVRQGVTAQTREQIVRVIESKINEAGLSGGDVRQVQTTAGEHFIVVEATDRDARELRELLSSRGQVTIEAYHRNENGTYVNTTVLTREDLSYVGPAQQNQRVGHHVPVTVEKSAAPEFSQKMVEAGFVGGTRCTYEANRNNTDPCLLTKVDDEVVYASGVESGLAASFQDGSFADDPQFIIRATNQSEASRLSVNLRAGSLPAPLDFDRGTTFTLEPALADRFKINSLITGLVAVIAVSLMVFFRYGQVRVAAPMVVTALSEVVLLLGFAAVVRLALDLSHIAGLIAVIGTGVDDLIIIADEVMSEGDVNSSRVFQSRFRKAFWVIGAAAATTIIAMSPLAILSLGDLRGFAIVTILGVLIGVLITRPAYGDILRKLTTER